MENTYIKEISSTDKQISSLADPGNTFQSLALSAMFWRPSYLETSAWVEHIPFAFWLIAAHQPRVFVELGVHNGTSYFAFCQAVDRLGLGTRCFAIDTWKGDEHAGFYDEQVFQKVKAHNDAQYSGFSRLVRSSFDDALGHFTDGSIDLIHIDGLHTLDAIRHDVDTWLPKLSNRAAMILHDTNVRERNFGVFKLFEQLRESFPAFEFVHGHGLGILGIGPEQTERLRYLYGSNNNESAKRSIHEVFSRLGRACADSLSIVQQNERVRKLDDEVKKQKTQLDEVKQGLEKTKSDLGARSKELADARGKLQTQLEQHAVERGHLAERATLLQEIRTELREETTRLQARIDAISIELQRRIEETARLEEASLAYQNQSRILSEKLEGRDHEIASLREERERRRAEIESLKSLIADRERELTQARNAHQVQVEENFQLREGGARLERENASIIKQLNTVGTDLEARAAVIDTLREELQKHRMANEPMQVRLDQRDRELSEARESLAMQIVEIDQLREKAASQSAEIDILSEGLAQRDAELNNAWSEVAASREETALLNTQLKEIERAYAEQQRNHEMLVRRFAQEEGKNEALARELEERSKEAMGFSQTAVSAENARAESERKYAHELAQLQAKLKAQGQEVQRLEQEKGAWQVERKTLTGKVEERFKEIAKLTQMLSVADKVRVDLEQRHSYELEQMEIKLKAQEAKMRRLAEENTASRGWTIPLGLFGHSALEKKRKKEFARQVQLLSQSDLFDAAWYLTRYPDVAESQIDPVEHYLRFGAAEGRDPGPAFSTKAYMKVNPDVAASSFNPLLHYLEYGRREGRTIQKPKER